MSNIKASDEGMVAIYKSYIGCINQERELDEFLIELRSRYKTLIEKMSIDGATENFDSIELEFYNYYNSAKENNRMAAHESYGRLKTLIVDSQINYEKKHGVSVRYEFSDDDWDRTRDVNLMAAEKAHVIKDQKRRESEFLADCHSKFNDASSLGLGEYFYRGKGFCSRELERQKHIELEKRRVSCRKRFGSLNEYKIKDCIELGY